MVAHNKVPKLTLLSLSLFSSLCSWVRLFQELWVVFLGFFESLLLWRFFLMCLQNLERRTICLVRRSIFLAIFFSSSSFITMALPFQSTHELVCFFLFWQLSSFFLLLFILSSMSREKTNPLSRSPMHCFFEEHSVMLLSVYSSVRLRIFWV
jgi:hypothetical protein